MNLSDKEVAKNLRYPDGEAGYIVASSMNENNESMSVRAINHLNLNLGETVVEIGAGNGLTSLKLLEQIGHEGKYVVVDHSAYILSKLRENIQRAGFNNFLTLHGDCLKIDFPKKIKTDALLACNVLYFIKDIPSLIYNLKSWCKPGCRLSFAVRTNKSMNKFPFTQYEFILRSESEYISDFRASKVKNINVSQYEDVVRLKSGEVHEVEYTIITGNL